jgi:nitronate monooxygenase
MPPRTWLTERFGLDVPLVAAPMGGVSGGALAAAVSAAGALGTIGYTGSSAQGLTAEAALARAAHRPFGIGLLAWSLPDAPGLLDAAIEAGPALLSISYGHYEPHLARAKAAGVTVTTQAGTVEDAQRAADAGVDFVVARGGEGGGHGRNAMATLPLLEAVLEEVDLPVVAAGGISTARGLAAVLAAGAAGAWVGTAFLACTEALTSAAARRSVIAATGTDTVYTTVLDVGRGIAWPAEFGGRAVRSEFTDRWDGREAELRASGERLDAPVAWAGEGVGLLRAERPAADVVGDFAAVEGLLRGVDDG